MADSSWRNRIIGEGEEEAGQLLANPKNWRIHPQEQEKALTGVLSEVGWVQRVIVNRRTGCVVDGHLRVAAALKRSEQEMVPVVYVDLSEREESLILATYDPLSAMAGSDNAKLDELLQELSQQRAETAEAVSEGTYAGEPPAQEEAVDEILAGLLVESPAQFSPPSKKEAVEMVEEVVKDEVEGYSSRLGAYCAVIESIDVVRGPCQVGCTYCFTKISPAAIGREGIIRRITEKSILKFLDEVEKGSRVATVGSANDPMQDKGLQPMEFLLRECEKRGLVVRVETKLPGKLLTCIRDAGVSPSIVECWTSFGVVAPHDARVVEPGAPQPMVRAEQSRQLHEAGATVFCRFAPFILGRHAHREELLAAMNFCKRLIVEPIRISKAGWQYFLKLNRMEGFNLDQYVGEWGRKDDQRTYGALHWVDYDVEKLMGEMKLLKAMGKKHGMKFGICSASFGWQYARLNDGPFCCDCGNPKVRPDKTALCYKVSNGTEKDYQFPAMFGGAKPGTPEWECAMSKISWANDPLYPLLDIT